MADTKISALTELAGADVVSGDKIPIVDNSASTTKYLDAGELGDIPTLTAAFAAKSQAINAQTGTSYTLVLTDADKLITLSNAGAITLTVPPNSSVAFPTGTRIDLAQLGAGQVTVAQGAGVTINVPASLTLLLAEQYAEATLTKYGTDTWIMAGNLEAA